MIVAATATATEIGGLVEDEPDECKYAIADKAPFDSSATYWREYVRTCKIVASHPEGVYLHTLLSELHGDESIEAGSTEYQRTRRFMNRNPEFFEVRKENGLVSARPTLELLDLINGGIIQNHRETPQLGNSEFCEKVLRSVKEVNDKGERLLEFNLREYVERINNLRLVLESEVAEPQYVTLPYKTRFNDPGRINKQWSIMSSCIEKAGEWFDKAALLTLTTDPKKFDSIHEMWTNINKSWNRLMSWLSSDAHLGYRPEYTKIVEATEKGYPHIHAIVYLEDESTRADGMPWIESKNAISEYWAKYQGEIVDVQPLTFEEELGDEYDPDEGWVRWDEDGDHGGDLGGEGEDRGGQTAGEYLGKYLSAIYGGIRETAGIEEDAGGVEERATATEEATEKYEDKAATWKVAMYWATGRKIRTDSRELRQAVEEEMEEREEEEEDVPDLSELVAVANYEFVGAYSYEDIPQHIRSNSVPIDGFVEEQEEPEVPPGAGDGRLPPSKVEKMKRRYPQRAWPLIEGMMGNS